MNYKVVLLLSTTLSALGIAPSLLDKRFNEVLFITAHNAQSYLGPTSQTIISLQNQDVNIPTQLAAGIRSMKLPIFWQDSMLVACHGINESVKKEVKDRVDAEIAKIKSKLPSWMRPLINFAKESVGKLYLSSSLFPQKLLNIYYNPDKVKPGDLDPATTPLTTLLSTVKTFLDRNPSEIITLFLEVYYNNPGAIAAAFSTSGLTNYLYVQPTSQPWPTLRQLVAKNKRLVVFLDINFDNTYYPFNKNSSFIWSSPYAFAAAQTLMSDSGSSGPSGTWQKTQNKLWILQHFVTPQFAGDRSQAAKVNAKSVIIDRVARYRKKWSLPKPNFVWVDFYNVPSSNGAFDAATAINAAA